MLIVAPIRQQDSYGRGEYGAPRGHKKHNGVDFAAYAGARVLAQVSGTVSKIGYPYDPSGPKGYLRYIEVTDQQGARGRYFYVLPTVAVGTKVTAGEPIGIAQSMQEVYPGITDHIHFEVKVGDRFINPLQYLMAKGITS